MARVCLYANQGQQWKLLTLHCLRRWPNIETTLFECQVFVYDICSYMYIKHL